MITSCFSTLITFFCNMDFLASPDLNMILMCVFFLSGQYLTCACPEMKKKEEERKTKSFRAFSSEILILTLVLEPFFIVFEPDDYCLDLWFPN